MSKSKYPEKIDGSKEIPVLRDDVIQSGAKAINSLRSAILQIEKTLGLNPHGSSGSTVASRLNASLDEVGNIKKEALDYLNLLKGPVGNSDIKTDAGISEEKLNLEFSTNFLYNQIVSSYRSISDLSKKLEELTTSLSAHLSDNATGRHTGKNVNIEAISTSSSDTALMSSEDITLQDFLKNLMSSHINYSGRFIAPDNNSHLASQIYYDKSIFSKLNSSDLQGAVDELATSANAELVSHQLTFHSNGKILRYKDEISLAENLSSTFLSYLYGSYTKGTEISLVTAIEDPGLSTSDFLKINHSDEDYYFNIVEIEYLSGLISKVKVAEDINFASGSAVVSFVRLTRESSMAPLNMVRVEHPDLSSSSTIAITNPSAPCIASKETDVLKLNSLNKFITIEVTGKDYIIDCLPPSNINLESVIAKINEEFSEKNAPLLAYKSSDDRDRIYICHMLESNNTRYIMIKPSSDNAYECLGFSDSINKKSYSSNFGGFYVSGYQKSRLKSKLETSLFRINPSEEITSLVGENLSSFKVKSGDIVVIEGSDSDDGAYIIKDVLDKSFKIDKSGFIFNGQAVDSGARFYINESTYSFKDLELTSSFSSASESGVYDIYLNSSLDVISKNILKYSSYPNSTGNSSLFQITSVDNKISEESSFGFFKEDSETLVLRYENTELVIKDMNHQHLSLNTLKGNKVYVFIENYQDLKSEVFSLGSMNVDFIINTSLDVVQNYLVGSVLFENFNGKVRGSIEYDSDSKSYFGNIKKENVSGLFLKEYFEEYRALDSKNAVMNGCEVFDAKDDGSSMYEFSVSAGKVVVSGKIISIDNKIYKTGVQFSSTSDRLYVAVNENGRIVYELSNSSGCLCPFDLSKNFLLAVINYNPSNSYFELTDLRIFLNEESLGKIGSIYINADKNRANFRSINSAFNYAKSISKLSDDFGTPKVIFSPGLHRLNIKFNSVNESDRNLESSFSSIIEKVYDSGMFIDFPVIIEGSGESTVLSFSSEWQDTVAPFDNSDQKYTGKIIISGESFLTSSFVPARPRVQNLSGKVIFKDLKLKNTQIFCIENTSDTMGEAAKSSASIELNNVSIDRDFFSGDSSIFVYTEKTSSYFYNSFFIKNSYIKNSEILLSDGASASTGSSTNGSKVFNFTISSTRISAENATDYLFRLNKATVGVLDGLHLSSNIYDENLYFYSGKLPYNTLGGQNDLLIRSDDFGSNKSNITIDARNRLTIASEKDDVRITGSLDVDVFPDEYVYIHPGQDVKIYPERDLNLNPTKNLGITAEDMTASVDTFSITATEVGAESKILSSSGQLVIEADGVGMGDGKVTVKGKQSAFLTCDGGPYVQTSKSPSSINFYNPSGTNTFSGKVVFDNEYYSTFAETYSIRGALSFGYTLLHKNLNNSTQPYATTQASIINTRVTDVDVGGHIFTPHSDGQITGISIFNYSNSYNSAVYLKIFEHTGGDPAVEYNWSLSSRSLGAISGFSTSNPTISSFSFEKGKTYIFMIEYSNKIYGEANIQMEYYNC